MSQGERQPVAGVVDSSPTADRSVPLGRREGIAHEWDSVFPSLLPTEQQSLLALAMRQGALRQDQIPTVDESFDRTQIFFTALQQNQAADILTPFQPEAITPFDADLDVTQRAAVAVAMQSPDLAVIRGLPGTGKSRTIAEIIRRAVRSHQRVLFAAASSAALDLVLERIHDDASVMALRVLSRDERAEQLPAVAAGRTFTAYRRQLSEEPIRHVRLAMQRSEAAIARWRADLVVLDRLAPVATQYREMFARRESLVDRLARVADEAARSTDGPFAQRFKELQSQHESGLAQKESEIAAALAQLHDLHKQVADAEDKLKAAELAHSERSLWNRLLGMGAARLQLQIDEAKNRIVMLREQRDQLAEICHRQAEERDAAVRAWQSQRRQLIDEETTRRRAELESDLAAASVELTEIGQRFQQAAQGLLSTCIRPDANAPAAVEQAQGSIRQSIEREKQEAAFARRWCDYLSSNTEQLLARLQRSFNAVFATRSALQTDERLAELTRNGVFDLVIIDEAHQHSEAELLPILRRGLRWVLVGEPSLVVDSKDAHSWHLNGREHSSTARRPATTAAGRSRSPLNSAYSDIWPHLCRNLEHTLWSRQDERLCCHLRPVTRAQRSQLEIETVADSPDVELQILTPDGGQPTLVEVRFPDSTAIEQALKYLYSELNEVPVPNTIPAWGESGGRLIARFADSPPTSIIELEAGLRLNLDGVGHVVAIDYQVSDGWGRQKAAGWLREHTRPAGFGRLIDLTVSFRMNSDMVRTISPIWFGNRFRPASEAAEPPALTVEFVAVQAGEPFPQRRHESGFNGNVQRSPAGLETDLSDARQRDYLMREFPGAIPPRGLVNLPEGRAIVSLLEERCGESVHQFGGMPGSIAVLTLHAAQAELIRGLMRESQALARPSIPLFVGHAAEFRQREADLVILSLTRSHGRRTVSYADDPGLVAIAVSRARQCLIVVGDPVMLARRGNWDGPLDHQDEFAAEREKAWVAALHKRLPELNRLALSSLEGIP